MARAELPTVEPQPEWMTKMGLRDLSGVEESDTDAVWSALTSEAMQTRTAAWREVQKEYRSLKYRSSQDQFVWHQAELRCRRPGGLYFFGRHICQQNRLIRRVHDKQMGRKFEQIPGTKNRQFLLCHRDSYKSTVAGVIQPMWILGVRPWERILLSGASDPDTAELIVAMEMSIDTNPRITATFPYLRPYVDPRRKMAKRWSERAMLTEGFRMSGKSIGRESSVMVCGAEKSPTRLHPTIWIFDDLINLTNSRYVSGVEQVLAFFREVMGNLGAGRMPCSGSGTMWRSDDLAAKMLSGDIGGFDVFKMPVRYTDDKTGQFVYNLPREEVLAQLPKEEEPDAHCGFDDETFAAVCEILTPYEVACQYYCDPSAREDTTLDPAWWKVYETESSGPGITAPWSTLGSGEEAEARWTDALNIVAAIDLAVSESNAAAYTAILVLGISEQGIVYVLDGLYDKMAIWQTQEALFQLYLPTSPGHIDYWRPRPLSMTSPVADPGLSPAAWRPVQVAIEKAGYSTALESGIKPREMEERFSIPWERVDITRGLEKGKRPRIISALGPMFSRGLVRIRKEMWKPSHHEGGLVDVTHLLHQEYLHIQDEGHPVDGLDCMSVSSVFFPMRGHKPRPQADEHSEQRAMIDRLLDGMLRPATEEDIRDFRGPPPQTDKGWVGVPAARQGDFLPGKIRQRQDITRIDFDPNRW